jgi:predicted N-acyltransferase
MAFEVRVVHSIREIGQESWDRMAGRRPFASYRWYCLGETVLADNLPLYIVLFRQGEPRACGTFWLRREEPLPIPSGLLRRAVGSLLRRWPLMICQAPLVDASGLMLPDDCQRDEAVATIAGVAREQAQTHDASFVACIYLEPQEAYLAGWPDLYGAVELPEPGTCLHISWPDFESYVACLSRSTRKDYRRHRNRAADLGVEVEVLSEVTEPEQALALIRNVEKRHGAMPDPWVPAALVNVAMVDATWLAARIEGRLVACGLLLRDGDSGVLKFLGLDYDAPFAYFRLVYEALQVAIESGCRTLIGGAGAYEMKRRLGFESVDTNYAVFAGRGPFLGGLGRWLARSEERKVQDPFDGT